MSKKPDNKRYVNGWIVRQDDALRVLALTQEPMPTSDLFWAREDDDLVVWGEGWIERLVFTHLSEEDWAQVEGGRGQWWFLEEGIFPPRAVFSVEVKQRVL